MERIKNYATALFLCLVLLLQGCLKVDEENFYAFHTGEVTLTEAGVAFEATIDKNFAQNAREFGVEYKFVYGDDDSDTWKRIACSRVLQNNDFAAHLSLSELLKNKTNQKGESLSQIKYVAYCDFSGSKEIAEERTFLISFCCLTAKPNNSSYGMVSSSGYYISNTEVTITATPKENYYFTGWSDCDSRELTRTITITSDTTITAIFSEKPYLTAKPNNSDYGTVTGSGLYEVGTKVTITATPKENYYLTGWSDCDSKELSRTITITSNTTITANFAKKIYLTVKTSNSAYGTVTGSGYYEVGSVATIAATPKSGYSFVQWNDGNTENPRTVTVTSDVTYTATFKVPAFSVSSGKYVVFSPGNLQYHPKNDEWRFAPSQLDYIGDGNENISSTYDGWLDLFGWSTSATNFGVSTSTSSSDYSGTFVDWGTNQIGTDAPNTWRTLTYNEWDYVVFDRPNASSLMGVAQVNGVNGLILLPDNWTCPAGVTFRSGFHDWDGVYYYAAYQTFTAAEWSKMEVAGAVFLPAAGGRDGSGVRDVQSDGNYWSASEYSSYYAYFLFFGSGVADMRESRHYNGRSVRLVKDL